MKKIILGVVCLLVLCGCSKKEDASLYSIGDTNYYVDELIDAYGEESFENLLFEIDYKLLKKETKEYEVTLQEEVDSQMEEFESYYGDKLETTIYQYYGYSIDKFKKKLYFDKALDTYINEIYSDKKDLSKKDINRKQYVTKHEALLYLREKYNVKFNNKKLQDLYDDYLDEKLENAKEHDKSNENEDGLSANLKNLDLSELVNMIYGGASFTLVVTRSDCSHCIEFLPILSEVLDDYDVEVYRIEIDSLGEEEYEYFDDLFENEVMGTPTILFIENGIENYDYRLIGKKDYDNLVELFTERGLIEEEE